MTSNQNTVVRTGKGNYNLLYNTVSLKIHYER